MSISSERRGSLRYSHTESEQNESHLTAGEPNYTSTETPPPQSEPRNAVRDEALRDLNPAALVIKDWERDFAGEMFPFIPSPRAAKRFTNIYCILKAPLSADELRVFEGTTNDPG